MLFSAQFMLLQGGFGLAGTGPQGSANRWSGGYRDGLAVLISNHEAMPAVEILGPRDAACLKDIALNPSYPTFTRGRAMRLLAMLQGEEAARFLEDMLRDEGESFYLRIEAAHVLKNILGSSRPDRLAGAVSLLLGSSDVRLRGTALHILSEMETPLAKSIIRDHGMIERHSDILSIYFPHQP